MYTSSAKNHSLPPAAPISEKFLKTSKHMLFLIKKIGLGQYKWLLAQATLNISNKKVGFVAYCWKDFFRKKSSIKIVLFYDIY